MMLPCNIIFPNVHQFRAKEDLGKMAVKGYFTLNRIPEVAPLHQIQFRVVTRTSLFEDLTLLQGYIWSDWVILTACQTVYRQVGWGCRIHRLHLRRYVNHTIVPHSFFDVLYYIKTIQFAWSIDFNGMSTHLSLFNTLRLGNRIHCTFICTFFEIFSWVFFLHTVLSNTNNLETDPFDSRTVAGATTANQSGPENDGIARVLYTL